jgi:hypothetical protein
VERGQARHSLAVEAFVVASSLWILKKEEDLFVDKHLALAV